MSEAHTQRRIRDFKSCASRRVRTTPTSRAACERSAQNKKGRSGGGIRIALGAAGKSL
jgi:hypothetical protein